jgi:hypothetical protein
MKAYFQGFLFFQAVFVGRPLTLAGLHWKSETFENHLVEVVDLIGNWSGLLIVLVSLVKVGVASRQLWVMARLIFRS